MKFKITMTEDPQYTHHTTFEDETIIVLVTKSSNFFPHIRPGKVYCANEVKPSCPFLKEDESYNCTKHGYLGPGKLGGSDLIPACLIEKEVDIDTICALASL